MGEERVKERGGNRHRGDERLRKRGDEKERGREKRERKKGLIDMEKKWEGEKCCVWR